jgi:hypothetical protein
MAEVPRIVRERLRSQAAGEHPDANLLSAFAEHSLKEQERADVLDHLSRCRECREVVALSAQPQVEEERLVAAGRAPAGASRSWWRSPVVHWGALTAAALVVLIAVATRMQLRQGHSASAPAIATSEPAKKSEVQATPAAPAAPEQKESRQFAQTPRMQRQAEASNVPKPAGAMAGKVVSGAAATRDVAPRVVGENVVATPAPRQPKLEKPSPATAATTGAVTNEGPLLEQKRKIDQAEVKALPAPPAATTETVEVTTPVAGVLESEGAPLSQGRSATFTLRASPSARWSISSSGSLQRSLDGGRSWKDVAVADGVAFRAVATVGNDVWAGGSGSVLFHSADGGEHWSRVRVQADSRALSGDIVRIDFADIQNGVVTTSTGEAWMTPNGGATWRMVRPQ